MVSSVVNVVVLAGLVSGGSADPVKVAAARLQAAKVPARVVAGAEGTALVARLPATAPSARPLVIWAAAPGDLDPVVAKLADAAVEALVVLAASPAPRRRDVVLVAGAVDAAQALELAPEILGGTALLGQGGWQQLGPDGAPRLLGVQRDEKQRLVARLAAYGPAGSPGQPPREQAAVRLSRAVVHLAEHRFPEHVSPSTQRLFQQLSARVTEEEAAPLRVLAQGEDAPGFAEAAKTVALDSRWGEQLHTTCTVTGLQAAEELKLPTKAVATVDCRLVPPHTPSRMAWGLVDITKDPRVVVERIKQPEPPPPSPADGELWDVVHAVVPARWPGAGVVAWVSLEPTDAPVLRAQGLQAYGLPPALVETALLGQVVDRLVH